MAEAKERREQREKSREVLLKHGFVHVTGLRAVLPGDGHEYTIRANRHRKETYDQDLRYDVLVVVTSVREVWVAFGRSIMPKEVILTLGLTRDSFGTEGMFNLIDVDQRRAREQDPNFNPAMENSVY